MYPEVLSVTVQDISSLAVCTGQAPLVSQTKVCWQRLSPSPPDSNRGPRLVGEGERRRGEEEGGEEEGGEEEGERRRGERRRGRGGGGRGGGGEECD